MSKFCVKCGRPIENGDVCACGGGAVNYQDASDQYGSTYVNPVQQNQQYGAQPYAQPYAQQYGTQTYAAQPYVQEAGGQYATQYGQQYNQPYGNQYGQYGGQRSRAYTNRNTQGVDFDAKKAESAWINFKNRVGIGEPETNGEDKYERGKNIVPECVKAVDGEVPVKQYVVAKLRSIPMLHWAEGRIQVTSKRVIFRAPGRCITGKTVLQHEFDINEISGIEAKKEPHFGLFEIMLALICSFAVSSLISIMFAAAYDVSKVLGVILALLGMVAGVVPPFVLNRKFLLKAVTVGASVGCVSVLSAAMHGNPFSLILMGLVVILWIICIVLCGLKTSLAIYIKTKNADSAITIRKNGRLWYAKSASGFNEVFPLSDTEKAIRELGAVIRDIQELGEQGVNKWRK